MTFDWKSIPENQKIIIYGASVYGELALRGLEQLGLELYCFADRVSRINNQYLGYRVIPPNDLENYKKECILIASADFYYEILNYLESIDCENIYDICSLLKLDLLEKNLSNRAKEMYHARENYFSAVNASKLTIIHLGYCVTEKCSLKCKDCSFMMQYYSKPKNIDLNIYKSSLDRFLQIVDYIAEFRIYGGEPFLNKEVYKLIIWIKDCKKIGVISIYTNGTIIPDEKTLEVMKDKKVKVHVSDYGHNIDCVNKLVAVLAKHNIIYFIRKYDMWQQAGGLLYRNYDEEKIIDIFNSCFATNCYHFLKGKFYVCPRAAHSINLGAIEENDEDVVDFTDLNFDDIYLKNKLIELMHNKKYIKACQYCDGLNNHIEGVEPAIQIKETLH